MTDMVYGHTHRRGEGPRCPSFPPHGVRARTSASCPTGVPQSPQCGSRRCRHLLHQRGDPRRSVMRKAPLIIYVVAFGAVASVAVAAYADQQADTMRRLLANAKGS